jgi:hydrogenase nickel incorporation protein HypA/HybF
VHEASLMASALELACAHAREAGASRVQRVRLRVGELSGVVPEALEFAFAALTTSGPAQGAVLEIEAVPAVYWCADCQGEFDAHAATPECPRCGVWSHRLKHGLELELSTLEVA